MDIMTYALCKKIAAGALSGISTVEIDGTTLVIITNDGTRHEMVFPTPENGVSVVDMAIDNSGSLICYLSDGNTVNAGIVPTVKGDPGYTPVKGVDYFTEEDINEILNSLSQELEGYQTKENLYLGAEGTGTPENPAEGTVLYAVKNSLETNFITQEVLGEYPTKVEMNEEINALRKELEESSELEII